MSENQGASPGELFCIFLTLAIIVLFLVIVFSASQCEARKDCYKACKDNVECIKVCAQ